MEHIKVEVNSHKEYVKKNFDLHTVTIESFAIYIAQWFNVQIVGSAHVKIFDMNEFPIRTDECLRDVLIHSAKCGNFYLKVNFSQITNEITDMNQIVTSEVS